MKIAITADLHLRTQKEHPERYQAFENILTQCVELEINDLIIAGDLFDKDFSDFSEFEEICSKQAYEKLEIKVIPGNHDSNLSNKNFVLDNLKIIEKPSIISFGKEWNIIFVPYEETKLMGEVIESLFSKIRCQNWAIVGHGDYINTGREINPYEKGIYMPLTYKDLEAFKPNKVFLGHIHQPTPDNKVVYPGSPCGIDINETGYRNFLIFDLEKNQLENRKVDTNILFFKASLVVFPTENSLELLENQINKCINDWNLLPGDNNKTLIRVNVSGYSPDRKLLEKFITKKFKEFNFEQKIDLSNVQIACDPEKDFVLEKSLEEIHYLESDLDLQDIYDETYNSILNLIYGG